jgi:hypothetical protein
MRLVDLREATLSKSGQSPTCYLRRWLAVLQGHDDLRPVVYPILATTLAAANVINPDPDASSNNQSPVPPETPLVAPRQVQR